MIRIKSYFSDSVEEIQYSGNLGELADACNPEWRTKKEWDYEFFVNGLPVKTEDLDNIEVSELCSVDIIYKPQGGVFKAVGKLLGGIVNLAFGFLMPKSRSSNHNRVNTPQGERLEASEIKANQARLGSVVPEIFGQYRVYMDYLSEPRRYFKDKRQQEIEALLCVGVGDYDIQPVKIGDTLMSDMDSTTSQIFKPNQDVGSYADLWHTVDEVGATSSGTTGLELAVDVASIESMQNTQPQGGYSFSGINGNTITRNGGSSFNALWQSGVTVRIGATVPVENYLTAGEVVRIRGDLKFIIDNDDLRRFFPAITISRLDLRPRQTSYPVFISRSESMDIIGYKYYTGASTIRDVSKFDYPEFKTGNFDMINGIDAVVTGVSGSIIRVNTFGVDIHGYSSSVEIQYISGGLDHPAWTNKFRATPVGVSTNIIEVDLFFPQGLCYINDNGSVGRNSAPIEIEITDALTGNLIESKRIVYSEATNDQVGYTERIQLNGFYEPLARLRRTERGSDSVQSHSQVTWYGLKSRLPSKRTYPNWTTMGVRIQSGGKLSAQSENTINAVVTRKLPVLQSNGTWSEPQATRDIASVIKYIAERIKYSDQELDMVELLRLHNNYWKPRNETFDYVFDEITVKQAIDTCLNAGMSNMTIANGQIRPVRDDIRTTIEQSYSEQNTVATISKTFRAKKTNDFDGVEVEYVDAEQGYQKKVIVCKLSQSQGVKLRKVSIRGVTDKLRAWRIGMRLASEDRYVNKDYTIKTEMDALNSDYGSFIGVIEETPQLSQSCLILKVESDHVVVSEKPIENATIFAWRDIVGKIQGHFNIIRIDDKKIYVDLPVKPVVSLNKELPHAYIGTSSKAIRECLVDEITPNGTDNATIKASNYDERVYAYDNSEIQ